MVHPTTLSTKTDDGDEGWRPWARRRRIWLSVLGEAFDVSAGRTYYAGDGAYATCFAGRDATRAFGTGDFSESGCVEDVRGMTLGELAGARHWRDFMRDKYRFVGVVAGGAFYDERGEETAVLREVREKLETYDREEARAKERVRMFPDCSSSWTAETGGFVWCDGDDGVARYPRNETTPSSSGEISARCACFPDLADTSARSKYAGCALTASRCRVSPPEPTSS